jgi:hypothetical protein
MRGAAQRRGAGGHHGRHAVAWGFFLDHMEEREKTDREAIAGEEMTERT